MGTREAALPPWGNALAGASGAVLANAIVYPLDLIKTRLQVQMRRKDRAVRRSDSNEQHYASSWDAITRIVEQEGISGLYFGLSGSLLGVASTNFAYFYCYAVVRSFYLVSTKVSKPPSTKVELCLGAAAGAAAQVFTIPVSVVTTRQQTQPARTRSGLIDTGREIVHSEDGWSGLWRGLKASLVLVVNPSITYAAYQRLRVLLFSKDSNLRPWEAFFLGATSKGLATIITQPLIVAKVGLQSGAPQDRVGKPFRSFIEVMAYIVENEGVTALFKGIGPQVLKGVLVQGLLMMIKERVEILFVLLFKYLRRLQYAKVQKTALMFVSHVT